MTLIEGGYYLKARKIQESKIAHAAPYVREVWDWLIKEANHKDKKYRGFTVKRGQLFRNYKQIRDGLHWMAGWRKMTYNENQMKKAMAYLRKELMVATTKEPGGVLITILNYDIYQNPKNYERTNERTVERTIGEPRENHRGTTFSNKNEKNEKNEKKKEGKEPSRSNSKKQFEQNSIPILLSEILLKFINSRNGTFKKPDIQAWGDSVDKMIRLDKRIPCEIFNVICWSQSDDFWQNNILSTAKLRKQFDQLKMKMLQKKAMPKQKGKQFHNAVVSEEWLENGK